MRLRLQNDHLKKALTSQQKKHCRTCREYATLAGQ
jgi:hypothetical protein